jgi:hypothetical protein
MRLRRPRKVFSKFIEGGSPEQSHLLPSDCDETISSSTCGENRSKGRPGAANLVHPNSTERPIAVHKPHQPIPRQERLQGMLYSFRVSGQDKAR